MIYGFLCKNLLEAIWSLSAVTSTPPFGFITSFNLVFAPNTLVFVPSILLVDDRLPSRLKRPGPCWRTCSVDNSCTFEFNLPKYSEANLSNGSSSSSTTSSRRVLAPASSSFLGTGVLVFTVVSPSDLRIDSNSDLTDYSCLLKVESKAPTISVWTSFFFF